MKNNQNSWKKSNEANEIWRHDTQQKDTQHNDPQHNGLISDIQRNDTQHKDALPLC